MGDDVIFRNHRHCIEIRLQRNLSFDAITDVVRSVALKFNCDRRLWNVTDHFDYSLEEIKEISRLGRQLWPEPARVGHVAADDLSYGLLRMFQAHREQENYVTRVFRDCGEALAWLRY